MRDPDPPVFLDCCHVEHPPASGHCQTTDCPNVEPPRRPFYEWASVAAVALLLAWVKWETGRGFVQIYFDSLPELF